MHSIDDEGSTGATLFKGACLIVGDSGRGIDNAGNVIQSLGTDREDTEVCLRDLQREGAVEEMGLAMLLAAGAGIVAPTPASTNGAHNCTLDDAKAGADVPAHMPRDRAPGDRLIELLTARGVVSTSPGTMRTAVAEPPTTNAAVCGSAGFRTRILQLHAGPAQLVPEIVNRPRSVGPGVQPRTAVQAGTGSRWEAAGAACPPRAVLVARRLPRTGTPLPARPAVSHGF